MSCTCLCNGDIDSDNCMVRGMQGRDTPHNHCVVQNLKLHQFHQGGASNIIIIKFVFAGTLHLTKFLSGGSMLLLKIDSEGAGGKLSQSVTGTKLLRKELFVICSLLKPQVFHL